MKNTTILLICMLLVLAFTMNFQCGERLVEPTPKYNFLGKLSLSPYKKVYAIGDTIQLHCYTNGKRLFDEKSSTNITLDTAFMVLDVWYSQLFPAQRQAGTLTSVTTQFTNSNTFSTTSPGFNIFRGHTSCTDSSFRFTMTLVPKKPGIYAIEPNFRISFCSNSLSYFHSTGRFVFDLVDVNKDVWLSIPPDIRSTSGPASEGKIDRNEWFVLEVL